MLTCRTLTLCQRLEEWSARQPQAPAYTELDGQGNASGSLTYGELRAEVARKAHALRELTDQRVVLALPNGLDFVTTFLGCLWAGAVPVVVMPPRREASWVHLRSVEQDCAPALLVGEGRFDIATRQTTPRELDSGQEIARRSSDPEGLAFLQYTSGSTSAPRGVMVTHANLSANAEMMRELQEQPWGCTMVSWLPVHHDMGLVGQVLQSLHLGGHLVLMSPATFLWRPYLWLKAISDYRAHTSGAPNFAFALAAEKVTAQERASLDLSCWENAFCGAERVRQPTEQAFCRTFAPHGFSPRAFRPCYGLAEATLCVSFRARAEENPYRGELGYANCGAPLAPTEVLILDPRGQRTLPEGEVGEIAVRGPSVTPGYWGQPAEKGRLLRTGDLGFLRSGALYVTGRLKDLIIVDGRNVHPEDLEGTVESCHPSVRPGQCTVFAMERQDRELLVVAIESRRADKLAMEQAIRRALSERHDVKVDHVLFLSPGGLPRTSSGKPRRGECARALGALCGVAPLEALQASLDPIESFLCRELSREAGAAFSPTHRFDDMGVSSVIRFSLMGELAQVLGVTVPGDATWRYATPRELAAAVREGFPQDLEPLRLGKGVPLVFLRDVTGGLKWCDEIVASLPEGLTVFGLHPHSQSATTLEQLAGLYIDVLTTHFGSSTYALVGYSFDGRLAYEVARQLQARGISVPLLAVVDTTSSDALQLSTAELWRQFRTRLLWQALEVVRQEGWPGLKRGMRFAADFFFKRLRQMAGREPRGKAPLQVPVEISSFRDRLKLTIRYRPQPYQGSMVVYRASSRSFSTLHCQGAGWDHLALGGVEIVDLEGDHWNIIKPPYAQILARDLARRLLSKTER